MTEKLKKKPRMTCKEYCPVWNEVDKDCEIYGEHRFTPRTCPHYNLEILEKKMIEKFIEDMLQKTENVAKNVANENSQDLTEQWKKGELPSGWYYVRLIRGEYRIDLYINGKNEWIDCPDNIIDTVVCEVPDYVEWRNMVNCACEEHEANKRIIEENKRLKQDVGNLGYKIKNQRHEIDNRLKEIEKLKELLKELYETVDVSDCKEGLLYRIDEALRR